MDLIPYQSLVVSCQALEDEPLYGTHHMVAMARAAIMGNASGIRANGIDDVSAIKKELETTVIGLNKKHYSNSDVFITPTLEDAIKIYEAGADIVAIDATNRARPDNLTIQETIKKLNELNIPVMADISTYEEGLNAYKYGSDYVSTTLSGYTSYSKQTDEPDIELVKHLAKQLPIPVVAEGRIRTPKQALDALKAGAHFVIVGSAITRPQEITNSFTEYLEENIKEV